jgi:hypothetical protein
MFVEMRWRGRLKKPPALVTPVSVEVSEGTEAIVVEEDGEVSSVSLRVLAPAVRAWLWQVGTRAWFEIVVFSDVTTRFFDASFPGSARAAIGCESPNRRMTRCHL